MNEQELYEMYRDEIGMPGENTRALTNEYSRLKSSGNYTTLQLCKNLLLIRFEMYRTMGMTINDSLTEKILKIADGYFPFIIFADTFVVNHNNRVDNLEAIVDSFEIIINVIVDEYNKIINVAETIFDKSDLQAKAALLIKEQTGIDIY